MNPLRSWSASRTHSRTSRSTSASSSPFSSKRSRLRSSKATMTKVNLLFEASAFWKSIRFHGNSFFWCQINRIGRRAPSLLAMRPMDFIGFRWQFSMISEEKCRRMISCSFRRARFLLVHWCFTLILGVMFVQLVGVVFRLAVPRGNSTGCLCICLGGTSRRKRNSCSPNLRCWRGQAFGYSWTWT